MSQALYNQLPASVRFLSCGYREPHPDEMFYGSQAEAKAAGEFYQNRNTLVNPSVLVAFQKNAQLILSVPISDFSKVDVLFAACVGSGACERVAVIWELSFL